MPVLNSQQLIADLQKQTQDILQEAIAQWQMLPTQTMLFKQSAETWSATQCLMHLNSYGNYYLPALKNQWKKPGKKVGFQPQNLRAVLSGTGLPD